MPSVKFPTVASRFLPFWFFVFLFKFGAGIHYSLIAIFGARILPLWAVGLCVGGASFIQLVLDVPTGFLIERYGHLRMLRVSTFCFLLAAAVLLFGLTPTTYITSVVLSALGWLCFGPGVAAYLLTHGPVAFMGRLTGLRRMCEAVGITLALLGLSTFRTLPSAVIGLVIIFPLLGAFAALIIAHYSRTPSVLGKDTHSRRLVSAASPATIRTVVRKLHPIGTAFGIYVFCASVMYSMIWFLFPLLIATSDTPGIYSVALAMFDLTVLFVDLPVGALVDRLPKRPLVVAGMAVMAIAALALSQHLTLAVVPLAVVPLAVLLSVGDEIAVVSLFAWLDERTSRVHHEGIVTGALTFIEDLGWSTGPIVAGLLAGVFTKSQTLLTGALVLSIGAVLCAILLFGSKMPRKA